MSELTFTRHHVQARFEESASSHLRTHQTFLHLQGGGEGEGERRERRKKRKEGEGRGREKCKANIMHTTCPTLHLHTVQKLFPWQPTLDRETTGSLHSRHFFTREAQLEQVTMCPHGINSVSRFLSEQTIHSVKFVSWS